jgi:5'-nucleotidase
MPIARSLCLLVMLLGAAASAGSGEQRRFRILLTNDDGIDAPGIAALARALEPLGDVSIVAPNQDQSGVSHATSILAGVRSVVPVAKDGAMNAHAVGGTPADCVLIAIRYLHEDEPFDIVVSGINDGTNVGIGSLYSGTVGATVEGALLGIPSVAFSQDSERREYAYSAAVAARIVEETLAKGLPPHTFLNVNVPAGEPKGIAVAPMGGSYLALEEFRPVGNRTDGTTGLRYVLRRANKEELSHMAGESDTSLYAAGYVTIAALRPDWTAEDSIARLNTWSMTLPAQTPSASESDRSADFR